jgi:hypothetical protein
MSCPEHSSIESRPPPGHPANSRSGYPCRIATLDSTLSPAGSYIVHCEEKNSRRAAAIVSGLP